MSKTKGLVRAVLLPGAIAVGAAAGIAALFSDDGAASEERVPEARKAMPLAAEPPPPAPEDEFPDLAGEPDLREAEPTQPEAPANQAAPEPAAPPPLTSEQREQAKQMLLLTIKHAVERGEAEPLRMARKVAQERRADNLLSPSDVEAIDLMLECMDQVPDARDEARDLIEFGAATPLSESLRKACE